MNDPMSREDAADDLREQAASCRRLSKRARSAECTVTPHGVVRARAKLNPGLDRAQHCRRTFR